MNNSYKGFTNIYKPKKVVHIEKIENLGVAKLREKRMKRWKREWKIALIERNNPKWIDLAEKVV